MSDITMCKGGGCPKKEHCFRYTARPTPHWQSYFVEPPYNPETQSCKYFLPNGKENDTLNSKETPQ